MSVLRRGWCGVVRRPVLAVFLVALTARVLVGGYVAVVHDGSLFTDDRQYVDVAGDRATGDTGHWDSYTEFLYDSNASLVVPMTWLFRAFGVHAALGQLQVALFGALVAALVVRVSLEVAARGVAVAAGLAVALLPSQVLFSSLTLKDALVWAALALLAVLSAVHARTEDRRRGLLLAGGTLLTLLFLAGLREHTLVVAAWALFLTAAVGTRRLRLQRVAAAGLLAVLVPLVVGAGAGGSALLSRASHLEEQRAAGAQGASTAVVAPPAAAEPQPQPQPEPEPVDGEQPSAPAARQPAEEQPAAAPDAPAEEQPVSSDGLFGDSEVAADASRNLAYLPRGLSVVVLQPYPWVPTDNVRLRLAGAESLVWYPLLLLAAISLAGLRSRARALAFPLVVAGGTALMWALVEGNLGTAYRHRGEFVWAVAVLAAAGAQLLLDRWQERRTAERVIDLLAAERTSVLAEDTPYPDPVPVPVRGRSGRASGGP